MLSLLILRLSGLVLLLALLPLRPLSGLLRRCLLSFSLLTLVIRLLSIGTTVLLCLSLLRLSVLTISLCLRLPRLPLPTRRLPLRILTQLLSNCVAGVSKFTAGAFQRVQLVPQHRISGLLDSLLQALNALVSEVFHLGRFLDESTLQKHVGLLECFVSSV